MFESYCQSAVLSAFCEILPNVGTLVSLRVWLELEHLGVSTKPYVPLKKFQETKKYFKSADNALKYSDFIDHQNHFHVICLFTLKLTRKWLELSLKGTKYLWVIWKCAISHQRLMAPSQLSQTIVFQNLSIHLS